MHRDLGSAAFHEHNAGSPPEEETGDDARRIHLSVQKAGGISRLEIFDDLFHDWPILDGFLPEARQALQQAAAFLDEHAC